LRSQKTGRRYVGSCKNLIERIRRHNAGESKSTKHGVPWVLIHTESFATRVRCPQRIGAVCSKSSYKPLRTADATGRLYPAREIEQNKAFGTNASTL